MLHDRVVKMAEKFKDIKTKHKYDIYNDKWWVCDGCRQFAHDMYLIEMESGKELCPDCFLEYEKAKDKT